MNSREQARFDMIKRVAIFGTNNSTDFTTAVPPSLLITPAQTQAAQLMADLNTADTGLIDRIAKNAESQQSGSGAEKSGTTAKSVLHDALMLELKGINRSAAAIAEAQDKPEIMANFRMPYGVSDTTLAAKAEAIADAAEPLASDFVALGHATTFVDDLGAHIEAFKNAKDPQSTGAQKRSGATAEFGPLLSEAMKKVKQLDAFMHNFYASDAEKMGEWHTASHVERQAKKKPAATPPKP